jgi:hypothetical protein
LPTFIFWGARSRPSYDSHSDRLISECLYTRARSMRGTRYLRLTID